MFPPPPPLPFAEEAFLHAGTRACRRKEEAGCLSENASSSLEHWTSHKPIEGQDLGRGGDRWGTALAVFPTLPKGYVDTAVSSIKGLAGVVGVF